jgi:hypothetical protein
MAEERGSFVTAEKMIRASVMSAISSWLSGFQQQPLGVTERRNKRRFM